MYTPLFNLNTLLLWWVRFSYKLQKSDLPWEIFDTNDERIFFFLTAEHQYFSSVLLSFNTLVSDHKLLPCSLLNWCMNTALWYRYWRIIFTELIEWKSERDTQTFGHKVEKKSLNRKLFLYFATNELTQKTFELVLFNCLVLSVVKRSSLLGWLELFHWEYIELHYHFTTT